MDLWRGEFPIPEEVKDPPEWPKSLQDVQATEISNLLLAYTALYNRVVWEESQARLKMSEVEIKRDESYARAYISAEGKTNKDKAQSAETDDTVVMLNKEYQRAKSQKEVLSSLKDIYEKYIQAISRHISLMQLILKEL
jgi:CII-binding regulator of phage lambda lysogenization HflD